MVFGAGVVLILLALFAAIRPSSIFYAEFPTGVETTFECGNAIFRTNVNGDLADEVRAQELCDEQHAIYAVLALFAVALGLTAVVFARRLESRTTRPEVLTS